MRPAAITIAMPRPSWLPMPPPKIIEDIARIVVIAVMRIGRIRVLPVATSASTRSMPPIRSWFA